MRRLPIRLPCALLVLSMLACGGPSPIDAGPPHDAGLHDAGNPMLDAGTPDAGEPDAGEPDAGTIDSGTPDSGTVDAGPIDAGTVDAGPIDSGTPDAGPIDSGTPDAGSWQTASTVCVMNGWCWEHPTPFGSDLTTVQVLAPDDIWVAGESAATYHYDGTHWRYFYAPLDPANVSTDRISRIMFAAPNDGWAYGGFGYARWNGTQWHNFATTQVAYTATGSAIFSPSSIVMSASVYASTWNGTAWTEQPGWPYGLTGIWGTSPTDLWGTGSNKVQHYDGATWTPAVLPDGGTIYFLGVWGSSNTDIWAGGIDPTGGALVHFDGSSWQRVASGVSDAILRIEGSSSTDVWMTTNQGPVLHFDGTAIRLTDAGFTNLLELDVTADAGPFIVGNGAAMLVSDGDGGLRSIVSRQSPPGLELRDIAGSGPNDLWAVGGGGLALHFTGTSWQRVDTGTTSQLLAVISDAPNSAYAVGANDTVLHFDGTQWQPLAPPPMPNNGLTGVWKTAASDLWVVADNKVARYNGSSWSSLTAPGGCCTSVFGFSNSDVWFAGNLGVFHWNGTAFTNTWSGSAGPGFLSIWGTSPSSMFASAYNVNNNQNLQQWNGTSWRPAANVYGNGFSRAHGSGPNRVMVSTTNLVWTWNGSSWSSETIGINTVGSPWVGPPGTTRLIGASGQILRK